MLQATEAVSPDGRRIAKLETKYSELLYRSLIATVTVENRDTGERIYVGRFDWSQYSGHEVCGIAFDADGTLLVGAKDEHVEHVTLPALGELSDLQVVERTCAALAAAYGDRAPMLADVVRALLGRGNGTGCAICCPRELVARDGYVCPDCHRLSWRRVMGRHPPDISMTLAESARALAAHAADPEQVLAILSARAAAIPPIRSCNVCLADPPPSPLDFWSSVGRACEACLRKHALEPK